MKQLEDMTEPELQRPEMIQALRETADRLQKRQEVPR